MFSNKIIDEDYSRSICVIKKDEKVVETIYLTELRRGAKKIDKEEFIESIGKYLDKFTGDEYVLKDEYEFEIVPSAPNKALDRQVFMTIGSSGSGKSYTLAKLAKRYNQIMPNNHILYASMNSLDNDPAYKELSKLTIPKNKKEKVVKEFNLAAIENTVDVFDENLKKTFLIMDDIHGDISGSLTVQDIDPTITPEAFKNMPLTEKTKINRIVKNKNSLIVDFMINTLKNALFLGRKQGISVNYTQHTFFTGKKLENQVLSEANQLIIFPNKCCKSILTRFLLKKLNMSQKQADKIIKRIWYQYDFCSIDLSASKRYFISPDAIVIL